MVGEMNQIVFLIQIQTLRISQNSRYPSSKYRDSTVFPMIDAQNFVLWSNINIKGSGVTFIDFLETTHCRNAVLQY